MDNINNWIINKLRIIMNEEQILAIVVEIKKTAELFIENYENKYYRKFLIGKLSVLINAITET